MIHRAHDNVPGTCELERILDEPGIVPSRLRPGAHALPSLVEATALRSGWIT
jgi:hypothetical protein